MSSKLNVAIKALKEKNAQIADLEKEVADLRAENEKLRAASAPTGAEAWIERQLQDDPGILEEFTGGSLAEAAEEGAD